MTASIAVAASDDHLKNKAKALAKKLNLPFTQENNPDYQYLLVIMKERLELRDNIKKKFGPIYVDFMAGKTGHRLKYGGGKSQLIARAVGLSKKRYPTVLDVTAGLGQDGFVLASLGCKVTLIERSPIIAELLEDGLSRAKEINEIKHFDIQLIHADAIDYLSQLKSVNLPDVIYLDPMFPLSKKTALVKKEMRVLRDIVGEDIDAGRLFSLALEKSARRVVVKRSRWAGYLNDKEPGIVVKGKSSRYDVYIV